MNFAKRLRFYLVGISLGILVVAVFFGPRAFRCSYFPNARVLEELRTKPLTVEPTPLAVLTAKGIDSSFLFSKVLKGAQITNFNSDEMRSKPCRTYRAVYVNDSLDLKFKFFLCKDKGIITEFESL